MQRAGWWGMFEETWPISLTMVFGSFVAGATAEGGGAVAFPVFTKLLGIASHDAKVFAFMIQSFGMTMAALVIWLRGIRVLWNVIAVGLAAGVAGLLTGEIFLTLPEPYPKLLFSTVAGVFGVFLIYNRWWVGHSPVDTVMLDRPLALAVVMITGFLGGMVASVVGVGLDMLIFIVLTLYFGVNEKVSTPTTVVMMGLLSVVGFLWHLQIPGHINNDLWRYWMSAVPVVIFGAPLGAWFCSRIRRDQLILFLLILIVVELVSTILLVPVDTIGWILLLLSLLISTIVFLLLIRARDTFA